MSDTRSTRLARAADLPADHSVTVHVLDDGWSIRRLAVVSDLLREGTLMSNCLAWDEYPRALRYARKGAAAPLYCQGLLRTRFYSLRDGDNLPRVTFCVANFSGRVRGHPRKIHSVLGRHNGPPTSVYLRRIYAWVATLPGPFYHVLDGHPQGRLITAEIAPYRPADAEREREEQNRASNEENYRRRARLLKVAAQIRNEVAARAGARAMQADANTASLTGR